jgi:hypothetical protein
MSMLLKKTANIEQLDDTDLMEMQHAEIGANFEGFPSYSGLLGLEDISDSEAVLLGRGQLPLLSMLIYLRKSYLPIP